MEQAHAARSAGPRRGCGPAVRFHHARGGGMEIIARRRLFRGAGGADVARSGGRHADFRRLRGVRL